MRERVDGWVSGLGWEWLGCKWMGKEYVGVEWVGGGGWDGGE